MKKTRIDEIMDCVERNFETLSLSNLRFYDIGRIFFEFLEIISVIVTFIFFLIYVLCSSKNPNTFFAIVATYVTLIALIVTTMDTREQLVREVELLHNLDKIRKLYPDNRKFDREYPLLKSLIIIKQKHPEISLLQLRELDKDMFTVETLLLFLYDMGARDCCGSSSRNCALTKKKELQTERFINLENVAKNHKFMKHFSEGGTIMECGRLVQKNSRLISWIQLHVGAQKRNQTSSWHGKSYFRDCLCSERRKTPGGM